MASIRKSVDSFTDISIEDSNEINKSLIDENIHIIIIMDDIDRLSPSEIIEVFQLVKLNATSQHIILSLF